MRNQAITLMNILVGIVVEVISTVAMAERQPPTIHPNMEIYPPVN